jgi:hypothetical protein
LGRYRNSEEPYKNRGLGSYGGRRLGNYIEGRQYSKPYFNPRQTRRYSRPPVERRGRGRLDRNSKPPYFQSPKPEQKYETVVKTEKMSSPLLEKNPRYRLENNGNVWVDTEQVAREVERRMEGKLTQQFFEKFRGELEELLSKAEKTREDSSKPTESEIEPVQEVERHAERDQGQKGDVETERLESDGGSPELAEGPKKDSVSVEGGFMFSKPFGLAIPIEVDEAELEQTAQKSSEKESEVESPESESGETESQDGTVASDEKESENIEAQGQDEVETENDSELGTESSEGEGVEPEDSAEEESGEEVREENLEDIAAEGLAECEEAGEVVPEEVTETGEVVSEPLPEEAELYPVEEEPMEVV